MADVGELGDVAGTADGLAVPLVEGSFCDGLGAHGADKVFGVPRLAQGGQNLQKGYSHQNDHQSKCLLRKLIRGGGES